jgi:hypothetical protein
MEGGREYIEKAVPDSPHGVVLQVGGWGSLLTTPHIKNVGCYEILHETSDIVRSFATLKQILKITATCRMLSSG